MQAVYLWLDGYLISLYRIFHDPIYAFFLGTFLLALIAVIIGQFSISVAFFVNRRHIEQLNKELIRWNNLSMEAMSRGNLTAYEGANNEANEVFGKLFFLSIAYSAAFLWPVPFFMGWMQMRFSGIEFPIPFSIPLIGSTVGFTAFFIIFFVICHYAFRKLQPYLPYFRKIYAILESYDNEKSRRKDIAKKAQNISGGETSPRPSAY